MDIKKIKELLGADEVTVRMCKSEVVVEAKIYDARMVIRQRFCVEALNAVIIPVEEFISNEIDLKAAKLSTRHKE